MAESENIGGISISVTADYSKLQSDIAASAQIAAQGGQEIAEALSKGAAGADALSGAVTAAASATATFEQQIEALVNSGSTLAEALAAVQVASEGIASGVGAAGESAAAAAEQMGLFDEAVSAPYADAAGQLNMFADAMEPIPGAAQSAAQAVAAMDQAVEQVVPAEEEAAHSTQSLVEQLVALGTALAFTRGMVDFAEAALHAADAVDDATKAMGMLSGNAQQAQETVAALRDIGKDAALGLPELLTASNRMTAFLGSSKDVPGILKAVADSAAVMGVSLSAASGGFERIIASGDLSQRSLMRLGLTLDDVAKAMGTTADKVADAFKELDQPQKVEAMTAALGKFKGAAKDLADDALGGLVRLSNQWHETLEAVGRAIDPVVKGMADFASSNIMPAIKGIAEAFASLPTPLKEIVVGVGLLAAAIVPIAALVGAATLAFGALSSALAPVLAAVTGLGAGLTGAGASYTAMLATGIAAAGIWIALAGAILYVGSAYYEMSKAQDQAAKAQAGYAQSIQVLEISLKRHGVDISELQAKYTQGLISQDQYSAGLRRLAIEYRNANPVLAEHGEALTKSFSTADAARIRMQALGEAVAATRKHLEDVTAKYNEHKATAADVAKAYDAWQGATNALAGAHQKLLPIVEDVHRATREFIAPILEFPTTAAVFAASTEAMNVKIQAESMALAEAQRWLVTIKGRYDEGRATAAEYAKALDLVEAAQTKLNKTIGEAPEVSFKTWAAHIRDAAIEADKLLPPIEALPPYIRTVNSDLRDMGIKVDEVGNLIENKMLKAYEDLGTKVHTLEEENAAWAKISQSVNKLADSDLPKVVAIYNEHIAQLRATGAAQGVIFEAEQKRLQTIIEIDEKSGKSAASQIVQSEHIRQAQERLYDSTHALGDLAVSVERDIDKGFKEIGSSIVDCIIEGKNFAKAMEDVGKQVVKMIMNDLVAYAYKQLKISILGIATAIDSSTAAWKRFGDAVKGAADQAGAAGRMANQEGGADDYGLSNVMGGDKSGAQGPGKGTSGAQGALGTAGSIADIVSAVSNLVGNVQMMHMNDSLKVLVNHSLRIANNIDQWYVASQDWFNQSFTRMGEIWRDMNTGFAAVVNAIGVGGIGGVPSPAGAIGNEEPIYSGLSGATPNVPVPMPIIPPMETAPPVFSVPSVPFTPRVSGGPSAATYNSATTNAGTTVGDVTFNVYGATDSRDTVRRIADSLKILSPNFAAFNG